MPTRSRFELSQPVGEWFGFVVCVQPYEMIVRYAKSELAMQSPRLWRWENRLKLRLMATLVYAFLLSLLDSALEPLRFALCRGLPKRCSQLRPQLGEKAKPAEHSCPQLGPCSHCTLASDNTSSVIGRWPSVRRPSSFARLSDHLPARPPPKQGSCLPYGSAQYLNGAAPKGENSKVTPSLISAGR